MKKVLPLALVLTGAIRGHSHQIMRSERIKVLSQALARAHHGRRSLQ